jgi:hypothetical protein
LFNYFNILLNKIIFAFIFLNDFSFFVRNQNIHHGPGYSGKGLATINTKKPIATAIASSKLLPVAVKAIAVLYCNQLQNTYR